LRVTLLHTYTGDRLQRHRFHDGHLGLAYIAACLIRAGHTVKVLDAKNSDVTDEDVTRHIGEFQPDIFGATAMTHEIHAAAHACEVVKQARPEVLTVVGGPHTTALPERTLTEFPPIDIAVMGEGEQTMLELAAVARSDWGPAAFREIQGITFRDGECACRTAQRPWMLDLDTLPVPAWDLFPSVSWPVFASRGCPFGCAFCQRVMGRRVRVRSVDSVIVELDALQERFGQHDAWFQDEIFGVNRNWMDEFLEKMSQRRATRSPGYTWGCNSRVNLADADLYRRMHAAGCTTLGFGIESGNEEILKRVQKGTTRAMAIRAIGMAREAGLETATFYIIGHPGETWRTALQTSTLAAQCNSSTIAVGVMVPYPGTEVWNMAKRGEHGYMLLSEDWRLYDKYFGGALAIKGLSHRMLELLQAFTYLYFYAYTRRWKSLFRFVWRFRHPALHLLKRLAFSAGGRPSPSAVGSS
jgi:anaerobic magnesium-protoporphyrin IX monomethyl ester cyclase